VRARERLLGMVLMTDDFTRKCTHEWGGLMPFWFPRVQLLAQDPNVRPAVRTFGYEWCLSTLKRLPAVPASQVVCHFTPFFKIQVRTHLHERSRCLRGVVNRWRRNSPSISALCSASEPLQPPRWLRPQVGQVPVERRHTLKAGVSPKKN